MLIEFYGLPGSGKTTLAKKLAKEKGYTIIKIRKKRELFFYNLIFLIKQPQRFFSLLYYVIKNSGNLPIFYFKLMNTFLDYNAKYQKAKRCENALLDQGYFLNVFALFDRALSKEEMKKFLKLSLKPDLLIVFDMPFSLRQERTQARGRFTRGNFSEEYQRRWQKAAEENNKMFLGLLDDIGIEYEKVDKETDNYNFLPLRKI